MTFDTQLSWECQELEENVKKGKIPLIWWGEEVILPSVLSKILTVIALETRNIIRQKITIGWFTQTSCHVKLIAIRNDRHLLFDFTISRDGLIFDSRTSSYNQGNEEICAVA